MKCNSISVWEWKVYTEHQLCSHSTTHTDGVKTNLKLKPTPVDFPKSNEVKRSGVIRLIAAPPTKALASPLRRSFFCQHGGWISTISSPFLLFFALARWECISPERSHPFFLFCSAEPKTILEVREASQIRRLMFYLSVQSVLFMQDGEIKSLGAGGQESALSVCSDFGREWVALENKRSQPDSRIFSRFSRGKAFRRRRRLH